MIEIDDKVTLIVSKKYQGYRFRVIEIIFDSKEEEKRVRLVRLFKNEKLGDTIHYSIEKCSNLRIVKKNPKHISNIENSKTISSIEI